MTGPTRPTRPIRPMRTATVLAPAKLNLWLEVLHRRADGFHELDTGMVAIELFDRVQLAPAPARGVRLSLAGPHASADVPAGAENLVVRAVEQALARAERLGAAAGGADIMLEKAIPSQSGMGGASSDAAAALRAVELALAVDLGADFRTGVLAELGSDCVFFDAARATGAAVCTGRGEVVRPASSPDRGWMFALFTPEVRCPTAAIYRALEIPLSRQPRLPRVRRELFSMAASEARTRLFNDLEKAAADVVPELARWRGLLESVGAGHFRLSGSGSTFFGLFDDPSEAEATVDRIVSTARAKGLAIRGRWVVRPARTSSESDVSGVRGDSPPSGIPSRPNGWGPERPR